MNLPIKFGEAKFVTNSEQSSSRVLTGQNRILEHSPGVPHEGAQTFLRAAAFVFRNNNSENCKNRLISLPGPSWEFRSPQGTLFPLS
jgi:hypothetical protein